MSPLINQGLYFLRVEKFQENFLNRAASIYDLDESSNQGRIAMWKNSFAFALTHPLGVGFGNFIVSFASGYESKSYEEVSSQIHERYNLPAKYVSAHSLYLQILVETGLVGLAIFVIFWLSMLNYFWRFVKHYSRTEDFLVYFVAQALLSGLWILAAGFFDITLFNDKVLMFFFINIGLAGLIVKRYQEYEEDPNP